MGWTGLDWAGVGWTVPDWAGLGWTGLGWTGPDWAGLGWPCWSERSILTKNRWTSVAECLRLEKKKHKLHDVFLMVPSTLTVYLKCE